MNEALASRCGKVPGLSAMTVAACFALYAGYHAIRMALDGLWGGFAIILPPFAAAVGMAYGVFLYRRSVKRYELVIDPEKQMIEFHHFTFASQFFPERPRDEESIGFHEILGIRPVPSAIASGDNYEVATTKGRVTIPSCMENLPLVVKTLSLLVEDNMSDRETSKTGLLKEPRITTPWYGWLLLLAALGLISWLAWAFVWKPYH